MRCFTFNRGTLIFAYFKLVLIKNREIVASFNLNYEATSVTIAHTKNQVAVGGKVTFFKDSIQMRRIFIRFLLKTGQ